jgi:hypothetical protein
MSSCTPAPTWSNLNDRVLMAEKISSEKAARAVAAESAPAVPPPTAETLTNALQHRPRDIAAYLKSLPPFLPREFVEQHSDYERKFNIYTEQMGLSDESRANAEYDRRRNLVAENPTPENLAILAQKSHDELKKEYGERRAVFEGLRAQLIQKHATVLSRMILPIVEKNAAGLRTQIDADFRTLHRHYGVPYDSANNPAIRAVDQWIHCQRRTLTWEDYAREVRYPPGWEMSLPGPDYFRAVCAGNFTPAPEAAPAGNPPLKTAADVAAARAA